MKILLTGITGTLAPYVQNELKKEGHEIILWRREDVDVENKGKVINFIKTKNPDYLMHLATGPADWLEAILQGIREQRIPLLWTSSEAVFGAHQQGPFSVETKPEPDSDYGKYKRQLEEMIKNMYPDQTHIVRLGWQIGEEPIKNNMLAYLVKEKTVRASKNWVLSTSFMEDTAAGLVQLLQSNTYGIHHLDSNHDNLSFYELVMALKEKYHLPINVIADHEPKRNNQLHSHKQWVPSLCEKLQSKEK